MRAVLFVSMLWLTIVLTLILMGCAPTVEYRAIPVGLIPAKPEVPLIRARALTCLSDEAYLSLVQRDRLCWQYAKELRALLGPETVP